MTVEHVLAWLKTLQTKPEHYYAGMLNSKKDKSFGVYQLGERRERTIAIGGSGNTKTGIKGISILVHWNSSSRETENAAANLYANIAAASSPLIGGKKVDYIKLIHDEPIDVGTDENGIFERVIELAIYYERN